MKAHQNTKFLSETVTGLDLQIFPLKGKISINNIHLLGNLSKQAF